MKFLESPLILDYCSTMSADSSHNCEMEHCDAKIADLEKRVVDAEIANIQQFCRGSIVLLLRTIGNGTTLTERYAQFRDFDHEQLGAWGSWHICYGSLASCFAYTICAAHGMFCTENVIFDRYVNIITKLDSLVTSFLLTREIPFDRLCDFLYHRPTGCWNVRTSAYMDKEDRFIDALSALDERLFSIVQSKTGKTPEFVVFQTLCADLVANLNNLINLRAMNRGASLQRLRKQRLTLVHKFLIKRVRVLDIERNIKSWFAMLSDDGRMPA